MMMMRVRVVHNLSRWTTRGCGTMGGSVMRGSAASASAAAVATRRGDWRSHHRVVSWLSQQRRHHESFAAVGKRRACVAGRRARTYAVRAAAAYADDGRELHAGDAATRDGSAEKKNHLVLVDGMSFVFRAYYGWNARGSGEGLTNAAGEDTSVLYSYANTICSLLELGPTHLAVCMDAKGKTFRHEMFTEYKANRPPTPAGLIETIPKVEQLVRDMGVPLLRLSGLEADDIIGTLTRRAVDADFRVSICSPDKDFYQLLGRDVRMLKPSKTNKGDPFAPFTVDDFRDMYDGILEPKQFVDFLALVGDSSDNIPGVEGVGPKTALALLDAYGDVESTLASASQVKGKRARESLSSEKGAASAMLSRRLVEIRQNLTAPSLNEPLLPLESLRVRPPSDGGAAANAAFDRYELETVRERYFRQSWGGLR